MPGGNGTGPLGQGPMTGRGLGYCTGYANPGFAAGGGRLGLGLGFRRGAGWHNPYYGYYGHPQFGRGQWFGRYYPTYNAAVNPYYSYPYTYGAGAAPETEITALKETLSQISDTLNGITQRISEIEKNKQGGT